MERWSFNLVGLILFLFFLSFEALCGDTAITPGGLLPRESMDDPIRKIEYTTTTYGLPALLEITDDPTRTSVIYPLRCLGVIGGGYFLAMAIGRLALDGGAGPVERTLLPRRRHPAIWLAAYIAAVPLLASIGALRDLKQAGMKGLFSPTGPANYPLLVLALALAGVPLVAIVLAIRGLLDRRKIQATRSFGTSAPLKPEIPWPFE
jgi:hypothetical protein